MSRAQIVRMLINRAISKHPDGITPCVKKKSLIACIKDYSEMGYIYLYYNVGQDTFVEREPVNN